MSDTRNIPREKLEQWRQAMDVSRLLEVAQTLQDVKHWKAEVSVRFIAEVALKLSAALSSIEAELEQPQQPVHFVPPVPTVALTGDAFQAYQQCRVVAHMSRSLADVHDARAAILAQVKEAPVEVIGESTAEIMEMLGDLLSNMDAVDESDEWVDPVFEAAQARWPVPSRSQSGDQGSNKTEPASASPSQPQAAICPECGCHFTGSLDGYYAVLESSQPQGEQSTAQAYDELSAAWLAMDGSPAAVARVNLALGMLGVRLFAAPQAAAQSTAPKLSTATMNDAGIKALHDRGHRKIIWSDAEACYLAMLAAAPSAQSTALEPVAWTLTETLKRRETTTRGYLWFADPQNCMWSPLYSTPEAAMALLGEARELVQALDNYATFPAPIKPPLDRLRARINALTGTGRKEQSNG